MESFKFNVVIENGYLYKGLQENFALRNVSEISYT
jgi:hypothetical protein